VDKNTKIIAQKRTASVPVPASVTKRTDENRTLRLCFDSIVKIKRSNKQNGKVWTKKVPGHPMRKNNAAPGENDKPTKTNTPVARGKTTCVFLKHSLV
jgi:hypothetical protein